MSIAYSYGDVLVTRPELLERMGQKGFHSFANALSRGEPASFEFSTGTARTKDLVFARATEGTGGGVIPAQEIGIGKPLTVFIRHIYTGSFGDKDLLATSAVKTLGGVQAEPEAVNLIRKKVNRHADIRTFAADEPGTPVVFYMKALTKPDSVVTVKLDLDDFKEEWFDTIGNAASGLAAIPVFAAAQPWLLVGSLVAKAAGKLLKAIFEKGFFFRVSEPISFTLPGETKAREGFTLLMDDDAFEQVKKDFKVDPETGQLVRKDGGGRYSGEAPYVVLALDGTEREELADFQRSAATAAALKNFRPEGESSMPVDELLGIVGAFNDLKFRQAADRKNQELMALPSGEQFEKERARLKQERDAAIANVRNAELKKSYP